MTQASAVPHPANPNPLRHPSVEFWWWILICAPEDPWCFPHKKKSCFDLIKRTHGTPSFLGAAPESRIMKWCFIVFTHGEKQQHLSLMIYSCLTANVRFDPWLFCIFLRDARSFESRPARAEHSQLHLLCSLMLTLDLLSRSASNKLQTVTTAEKITCRSADSNVKSGGSFCVCVCVFH